MIHFKTDEEINTMKETCQLAAEVLLMIEPYVKPGVTTERLDQICHDYIVSHGAVPSPLNYRGFPKSICSSVNEEICHGIPSSRKLRNGDIIEELRDEVQSFNYDLTIIGGSGKRSMAHDLVQYIDSSIFVVNNFNRKQTYRILLAVDDSEGNKKAVKFAVRVAQAFNIEVDIVSITNEKRVSEKFHSYSHRAEKMMRRTGVKSKVRFVKGDLVDTLLDVAGNNHIIVMGRSSQSPLSKFFLGSKPLAVMESCNCPMVIVK